MTLTSFFAGQVANNKDVTGDHDFPPGPQWTPPDQENPTGTGSGSGGDNKPLVLLINGL